jgi:hypothetical protein
MKTLTTVELLQQRIRGPQTTEASLKREFQSHYVAIENPTAPAQFPLQDLQNTSPQVPYVAGKKKQLGIGENKDSLSSRKRFKSYPTPSPSVSPSLDFTGDRKLKQEPYVEEEPLTELSLVVGPVFRAYDSVILVGSCLNLLLRRTARKEFDHFTNGKVNVYLLKAFYRSKGTLYIQVGATMIIH